MSGFFFAMSGDGVAGRAESRGYRGNPLMTQRRFRPA